MDLDIDIEAPWPAGKWENLAARAAEYEVLPACEDYGMGVIPWSPLWRGLLAGVLDAEGGRRSSGSLSRDSRLQECRDDQRDHGSGGEEADHGWGAIPSVISIFVPHGSAMNATRIVVTKLLGVSCCVMVTPSASIRLRNAGKSFTSKPM